MDGPDLTKVQMLAAKRLRTTIHLSFPESIQAVLKPEDESKYNLAALAQEEIDAQAKVKADDLAAIKEHEQQKQEG